MKFRRPRNSTLASIMIFLVSFGFWLGQPQPIRNYTYVEIPDLSSTTTSTMIVETTVVESTMVETTMVETTIPTETTTDPLLVETTLLPETTVVP
jgi:hypothetical protein